MAIYSSTYTGGATAPLTFDARIATSVGGAVLSPGGDAATRQLKSANYTGATELIDVHAATIFVLDDEAANVILLERLLQNDGYRNLHSATDSREGLRQCLAEPPDLLMLDLMMPHMDGYAVLETLRAAWGTENPVPVLVLTADASREACRRALSLGASDFVNKPIDMMETRLRARNLITTRLLDQQLRAANAQLEARVSQRTRELERINLDLQESQTEALEKLAQAAEFRDDDTGEHIRRVGNCAELLALALGFARSRSATHRTRRAPPRHRQNRDFRRDFAQAGQAHRRRVRHYENPRDDGRRAAVALAFAIDATRRNYRAHPSRTLQRHGLSSAINGR